MDLRVSPSPYLASSSVTNKSANQTDADTQELTSFLEVASDIAKVFCEVIINPHTFFKLSSKPAKTQSISFSCLPESDLARLNVVYISQNDLYHVHHFKTMVTGLHPFAFGFREFKFIHYGRKDVILSFPNNELFNHLLSKLPKIFSYAIQSTYLAKGEISEEIHTANWIKSSSWPYDGDAKDLSEVNQALHDAHHILRVLGARHSLANFLFFLKSRLKEKTQEQPLSAKEAKALSGKLELLHNEGYDLFTKYLYIRNSKLELSTWGNLSEKFNGIISPSEHSIRLEENEEQYNTRILLHEKIFTNKDDLLIASYRSWRSRWKSTEVLLDCEGVAMSLGIQEGSL